MLDYAIIFKMGDEKARRFTDASMALISLLSLILLNIKNVQKICQILLLAIPDEFCIKTATEDIMFRFSDEVVGIRDFHAWYLVKGQNIARLTIVYKNEQVTKNNTKKCE